MNEQHYLYGILAGTCRLPALGAGVDARFAVTLVPCGSLTALSSLVGLDRFDVRKLEEGTADVQWLSDVAIRHNAILSAAARRGPLLPLRLGTMFHTRASMLARVASHETRVTEFLQSLGDRLEWAVKVFTDEAPGKTAAPEPLPASAINGTQYLANRRAAAVRQREIQAAVAREMTATMSHLQRHADAWSDNRPLPHALTGHAGKLVWNSALLVSGQREQAFHTACEEMEHGLAAKGFRLEVSGPWPAYHFCPALEVEGETHATAPVGR